MNTTHEFSDEIILPVFIQKIADRANLGHDDKLFVIAPNAQNRWILVSELEGALRHIARSPAALLDTSEKMRAVREMARHGIPALGRNTYWFLIALRAGRPDNPQIMTHAMNNMRICANAMGLGFQMITASGMIAKSARAMKILGLDSGLYSISGCVVGILEK
jgi:hypothetical protein